MLVAPVVLGALLAGRLDWRHLLLLAFVVSGYLAFFATGLWLKSRRKARYLPPLRAYLPLAALLGLGVLAAAPHLLTWAPLFALPLAIGLYASATRDERSIWSGLATTAGATLLTPVAYDVTGGWGDQTATVWWATAALGGYLAGTVFYVKTMIRERGAKGWALASLGWHVLALLVVAMTPDVVDRVAEHPAATTVYVLLLLRSMLFPRYRLSPKAVGIIEIVATVAVVLALGLGR